MKIKTFFTMLLFCWGLGGCTVLPENVFVEPAEAASTPATPTAAAPEETKTPFQPIQTESPTQVPTAELERPTAVPIVQPTALSPQPTEVVQLTPVVIYLTADEANFLFLTWGYIQREVGFYEGTTSDWWGGFCVFYDEPITIEGLEEIRTMGDLYRLVETQNPWATGFTTDLFSRCSTSISMNKSDWGNQIVVFLVDS